MVTLVLVEHFHREDAFDCDVKGTGTTNRFYYLTDLDSTTAILLSSTFSYKHFSTLYNLAGSAPCGARPVIEVFKKMIWIISVKGDVFYEKEKRIFVAHYLL